MARSGERTRGEIVESALQLFSAKGFHNTSINDLLDETGLTKGGLYGHFSSKEEVFEAAHARASEIWRGIVFPGVMDISDPLERIMKVVERDMLDYLGGGVFRGGCFFLNLLVELSTQSPEMAARIDRGIGGFGKVIERWLQEAREKGLLREGVEVAEVAGFIITAVNGAAALYAAKKERALLVSTVRQIGLYLDSLRARA